MVDPLSLSNAPLPHRGMDYAFLRQEGLDLIEKLASSIWTDYNAHDPGITILEAWCYALTDLSYRLDFPLQDLLACTSGEPTPPLFLTAREILTCQPLTINDYRKLLIDIEGVKNAWLEPIQCPQPQLYYDVSEAKLTTASQAQPLTELPVNLRGLYRVLLELENSEQNKAEELKKTVTDSVTDILNRNRNLCEDFAEIIVMEPEEITIKADIEIADTIDPNQLMAQLHSALEKLVSPSLEFLSLQEMRDRGYSIEEIFAGPQLVQGFIDDKQLRQFDNKTELHTSDIIKVILSLQGIKTIRSISLANSSSLPPQPWVLALNPQQTPRLKSIEKFTQDVQFYKGQISYPLDSKKVTEAKTLLPDQTHRPYLERQDIPIPKGSDRKLAEYETIQSEFPLTYGIGEIGLPASASEARKAQAKQLQAYLMIFDQLLANYFAQLDRIKNLFSPDTDLKTYFTQNIASFPGGEAVLKKEDYTKYIGIDKENFERKNRFLDHLLAQYGETFTDSSLLLYNPTSDSLNTEYIKNKVDFIKDYRRVSAGRNQAFNYTFQSDRQDGNVSGLKLRIARLLGMEPEGFHLVEHILLRPRPKEPNNDTPHDLLGFAKPITNFTSSNGYVTCTSANHDLQVGEQINIFNSNIIDFNGTYKIVNPTTDTFDIAQKNIEKISSGVWVRSNQSRDPFSFQISIIFPKDPTNGENFKQLVRDIFIAETAAHITLKFHWLDLEIMEKFKADYSFWFGYLAGNITNTTEANNARTRLINYLDLGSSDILKAPALIPYMVIRKDDGDSEENPFTIG